MSFSATPSMVTAPIYSTVHTPPSGYCRGIIQTEMVVWFLYHFTTQREREREREREWLLIINYHISCECCVWGTWKSTIYHWWVSYSVLRLRWMNNNSLGLTIQRTLFIHVLHQLFLIRPCTGKPGGTFLDRHC
jgi:hypothetical protein